MVRVTTAVDDDDWLPGCLAMRWLGMLSSFCRYNVSAGEGWGASTLTQLINADYACFIFTRSALAPAPATAPDLPC